MSGTPERQNEVVLLLPLAYFVYGVLVERLISIVVGIELEEVFAPIVVAISLLPIIIGQD
jgi:hypothetical protein